MSTCVTPIQGTRMRITRVDECGLPLAGDCNMAVTKGFMSVAISDNVESPDEFKLKNAGGEFELNQRSNPLLNYLETKINLTQISPEIINFMTGAPLIYDDSTDPIAVGVALDSDNYAIGSFALELWTNLGRRRGSAACPAGGAQHGYLLLPWLVQGTMEDRTVENGPLTVTIDNITSDGNQWGVGPYDVILDHLGAASPLLEEIPSTRHQHMQVTSLAPPAPFCGCEPLVIPS